MRMGAAAPPLQRSPSGNVVTSQRPAALKRNTQKAHAPRGVGMLRKAVAYALTGALTVATVSYAVLPQPRSRVDTAHARGQLVGGLSGTTPGLSVPDPVPARW